MRIKVPKLCECKKEKPSFNYPGEKIPTCCISCKSFEMICVYGNKCICGKGIRYCSEPGNWYAVCCDECKTDTMVDVKYKRQRTH
jgi:hypothetical protein